MDIIKGWIYILGNDINTDEIVPSNTLTMRNPDEIAKNTLKFIDPEFINKVDEDAIILAGTNFGTGSSREEAVILF
jgi:3-isopropylmalate dehydratase small subunit